MLLYIFIVKFALHFRWATNTTNVNLTTTRNDDNITMEQQIEFGLYIHGWLAALARKYFDV